MDSRHRPGRQTRRHGRNRPAQHRLRAALRRRRLDVRRRGRARSGVDDVAGQSAQPETGDPSRPGVHEGRRRRRQRDERLGEGILRTRDDCRLAEAARLHDQDLPRPRPAPGRSSRAPHQRRELLRLDRRPGAVCREQSAAAPAVRRLRRVVSAEDPDGGRSGAVERHDDGPRAAPGPDRRHDQGLRAGRADRGVLPVDGDSRRAGPALHRLQHRPLGLHQQRVGCDGVGAGVRQPEHRRHHHDLRLHADLRGPRAPRGEHAGRARASTRCGRAAWSRTSRSARRPASPTR